MKDLIRTTNTPFKEGDVDAVANDQTQGCKTGIEGLMTPCCVQPNGLRFAELFKPFKMQACT